MQLLRNQYHWLWAIVLTLIVSSYVVAQERPLQTNPVSELADALISAKTEQDRDALLKQKNALLTVELRKALVLRADGFIKESEYPQAKDVLAIAGMVAERVGDKSGAADVLRYAARVDHLLANNALALERLHQAVLIYRVLGDKAGVGRTLLDIAKINNELRERAAALASIQEAITQFEALDSKPDITSALNTMAGIYLDGDQGDLALQLFEKSLRIDPSAANSLKVATAFYYKTDYVRAVQYYRQALAGFEKEQNLTGYRDTLYLLASAYSEQANYELAFGYQIQSLRLEQEYGNKESVAAGYMSLGDTYMHLGNLSLAADSYQRSLDIEKELGNKIGTGIRLANLGVILEMQGNLDPALERYQESLTQLTAADFSKGAARVLSHIGNVYFAQRKYSAALSSFQESLALSQAEGNKLAIANAFLNVGMGRVALGKSVDALEDDQEALALVEGLGIKEEISNALVNLAGVQGLLGDRRAALADSLRAVALSKQTSNLGIQCAAWFQLGKAYQDLNRPDEARDAFEQAVSASEATSKMNGVQSSERNSSYPFIALMSLLIDQNKIADALSFAERAKAQVLRNILRSGDAKIVKEETADEQEEELRLAGILLSLTTKLNQENQRDPVDHALKESLDARLRKARLEYGEFQAKLYKTHPKLRVYRGALAPPTPETIKALVPDANTALAEYVVTDNRTYLFVLSGQRPSETRTRGSSLVLNVYALPLGERELADRVARFRELIRKRGKNLSSAAAELYDLLVKPAQKQLDGKRNVIVVPDGQLWALPFPALKPRENRYLIEDLAISYAPSLSALKEMMTQQDARAGNHAAGSAVLALGNPLLTADVLNYLNPGQRQIALDFGTQLAQEVAGIRDGYGGSVKTLTGREATADNLRQEAGPYRILHFATPALLDDASPMYSSIGLSAASPKGEGLLQPKQIMALDLQADLVVLSAASTSPNHNRMGSGIIGMTWAWFVAGGSSVLLSQWRDQSGAPVNLMTEFYRGVKTRPPGQSPNHSRSEALRGAMLKLLRDGVHQEPYYWSGFMLLGDRR
jgi:CHAT domain-containing protein/Tfp pilus assembly protein PilF